MDLPWHIHLPSLLPHSAFSFIKQGKNLSEGDGEAFESKSSNPTWYVSPFLLGYYKIIIAGTTLPASGVYSPFHPLTLNYLYQAWIYLLLLSEV